MTSLRVNVAKHFCKGPDNKYFRLLGAYDICHTAQSFCTMKTAVGGHFLPEFPLWILKSESHDSQIPQDRFDLFFLLATQKCEKYILVCELYKVVYVASCRPVWDYIVKLYLEKRKTDAGKLSFQNIAIVP